MNTQEYLSQLSDVLFWDIDREQLDPDLHARQIVQRVLEYGNWDDWKAIRAYYGIPRIAEVCKQMRSLDPVCLSYISLISDTPKEEFRCYQLAQSNPTLWNS